MTNDIETTTDVVIDLAEADPADVASIGGKAAGLAQLLRGGFDVPRGVVVPTGAVAGLLGENPAGLDGVVDRVVEALGNGPFAVRSSAVGEDSLNGSFAGIFETKLRVTGRADLKDAIRAIASSRDSAIAAEYSGGEAGPMAVVVQELVDADTAGVAFAADPVTGERDRTIVSAVTGLGERLVSGEVTPDEWQVERGVVSLRTAGEGALSEDQVLEVAELADRVTSHFGDIPQDIEWAYAGGRLFALQSRPITGLPDVDPLQPTIDPPEPGFWSFDGGHYPRPISPMAASFYHPAIARHATAAFGEFGALVEGIEIAIVGWRPYVRVIPPMGKDGPPPPAWLLGLLTRLVPPLRKKVARGRRAAEENLGDRYAEQWWAEWRDQFRDELAILSAVDLSTLSDAELIERLRRLIDLNDRGQEVHFKLFVPYMLGVYDLMQFGSDVLGWSEAKTVQLMAGLSEWSTEPSRRLEALSALAYASPPVVELLDADEHVAIDDLGNADAGFGAALDEYMQLFGARATGYDVADPTIGESSDTLIQNLRNLRPGRASAPGQRLPDRAELATEARTLLADRSDKLAQFEALFEKVEHVYPLREDNVFFTDNLPIGLIRLTALEMGARLVGRGLLDEHAHIVYLDVDEAIRAIEAGEDHRKHVLQRRREHAWAERHTPVPSFGTEYPPPDLTKVPRHTRRLMQALLWYIERDIAAPVGDGLTGTPVSPGSYTGPVRIVRGEADFTKVQAGDVLVAPVTTPAWTVLFAVAGALVTDTGGLLSHAAVVAREHGLPAVVATGSATSLLEDGQVVTVDGTGGRIEISPDS
ncbi:MAG: PEP/pyruvate-binding domain-containing protein [Acidimicrobiia bacterium]|nr:MAG: PEP/pyruvate-binding domain-containing protein [Acidimicrobiia bacterium]